MPREFQRRHRVAAQIQRDLAEVVRQEVRDPRLATVTFCGVDVTRDLAYAKVYVAVLGDNLTAGEGARDAALSALRHAAPFLRNALARRLRMRTVPELQFHYDDSLDRGAQVSALLDEALRDDEGSTS